MKRLALTLLLLFCFCVTANAANYVEISTDDKYLLYIDVDSIQPSAYFYEDDDLYAFAECIIALVKWIPEGNRAKELFKEYKGANYIVEACAFNISKEEYQVLHQYIYDKKDSLIDHRECAFDVYGYHSITPGTYRSDLYSFVNRYYNDLWRIK